MKNVLLATVSPPVDLARGRETQIGPILAHVWHFGTFGLSGALLLDPENQRNGESYLLILSNTRGRGGQQVSKMWVWARLPPKLGPGGLGTLMGGSGVKFRVGLHPLEVGRP